MRLKFLSDILLRMTGFRKRESNNAILVSFEIGVRQKSEFLSHVRYTCRKPISSCGGFASCFVSNPQRFESLF